MTGVDWDSNDSETELGGDGNVMKPDRFQVDRKNAAKVERDEKKKVWRVTTGVCS